jgi:hypothetical protein
MAFHVFHTADVCPNGPEERYEFFFNAPAQMGPTWSTYIVEQGDIPGGAGGMLLTRCRAIHPRHDCQCVKPKQHTGTHSCWHYGWQSQWPVRRRIGAKFVDVPTRTLEPSFVGVMATAAGAPIVYADEKGEPTLDWRIEQAHVVEATKTRAKVKRSAEK